jgi:hypothetical protein
MVHAYNPNHERAKRILVRSLRDGKIEGKHVLSEK